MTKNELIKEYQNVIVTAFNSYLDTVYEISDNYFDPDTKELKENYTKNKKLENFLKEVQKQAERYEEVRKKVLNSEDLTLLEVNECVGVILYIIETWNQQIKELEKSKAALEKLAQTLTSPNDEVENPNS